jgi:hypothetical protein
MTRKDQVYVADVVVINSTQKMMALNVISWLVGVVAELSAIPKIRKYRRVHEGHHFILMAMQVHDPLGHDMDRFIRECTHLFHDRWLGGHLSLSFCIQFLREHVNIVLQCVLAFAIKSKFALAGDACFKPHITIKFHDLHVGNIREVVSDIVSWISRFACWQH